MSQHVSGSLGQIVRQDFGEFICIGETRVRKNQILSYSWCGISEDPNFPEQGRFGVKMLLTTYGFIGAAVGSREDANKAVERLDWIFKKDESVGTP